MAPNRSTYFLPQERFDEIKQKYPKFNEPWTPDEENVLYELTEQKATQKQMAETLGRTPRSVKLKLMELGIYEKKASARSWSENEEQKLVALYNTGAGFENIALELGRSVNAVVSRLVRLRIDLFKKPEAD
ncbi:MAG: hypothetical protein J6X25_06230 [Bacteroidales bacterium]|nr:hypothetical protein [Bacteroidales bacterium]